VTIYKKDDITNFSNYHKLHTKLYPTLLSRLTLMWIKLLGIISVRFNVTDQLQCRFFAFVRRWRRNGSTVRTYISYLQILKNRVIQLRASIVQ
jgi:hypothetical protein